MAKCLGASIVEHEASILEKARKLKHFMQHGYQTRQQYASSLHFYRIAACRHFALTTTIYQISIDYFDVSKYRIY